MFHLGHDLNKISLGQWIDGTLYFNKIAMLYDFAQRYILINL